MAVKDNRIGKRNTKGRFTAVPARYATGEIYNPVANPAPTLYWIDPNCEYFCILPAGTAKISDVLRNELMKAIGMEDWIGKNPHARTEDISDQDDYDADYDAEAEIEILPPPKPRRRVVISGDK